MKGDLFIKDTEMADSRFFIHSILLVLICLGAGLAIILLIEELGVNHWAKRGLMLALACLAIFSVLNIREKRQSSNKQK